MTSAPPDPPDLVGDDFRAYELPPHVHSMIPAAAVPGEPGLHWLARGLAVETAAHLAATARWLDVIAVGGVVIIGVELGPAAAPARPGSTEPPTPDAVSIRVGLTVIPDGRWMLAVQGALVAAAENVPPARRLAALVAEHHRDADTEGAGR